MTYNYSNETIVNSDAQNHAGIVDFIMIIILGYLLPFFSVIGLIDNIIVIFVFLTIKMQSALITKIYYLIMAVTDFITLLTYDLLNIYLGEGIYRMTRGSVIIF